MRIAGRREVKKAFALVLLMVCLSTLCFASEGDPDQSIRKFQKQNALVGFGVGSRHQGDRGNADLLLGLDITGTALTVSGGLALAGSIIVYDGLRAAVGEVSKADILISAGVLGAGLATLVVSRILGWNMPLRY